MSQFTRTRVRCEVMPSKTGALFTAIVTGQAPKIFKGAGCDFEFGLFDLDDTLLDVSNISDVTLLVQPVNGGATEILKSGTITPGITQDQWDSGQKAHLTFSLLGTETSIAAGIHELTIWGHTQDASLDPDVFGWSTLTVIDAGITAVTNPVLTPSYATLDQVQQMISNSNQILPPGKTISFTTPDGLNRRIIGVDNGPVAIDYFETL